MAGKKTNSQDNYWRTHLTEDEFFSYLPTITSVNGIYDLSNIEYEAKHDNEGHSKYQFSSVVRFTPDQKWQVIRSITQKCEFCGTEYKAKLINLRNKKQSLCHDCAFTNRHTKFKIDSITGCRYQSTLEEAFLKRCGILGIKVENGPTIDYVSPYGIPHKYHIDFYLPEYKALIEIKGLNIYFDYDTRSGKIQCKNEAAEKYAIERGIKFVFMTNIDWKFKLQELITNG